MPLTITGANKEHRVYRADRGKVDAIVAVVESRPFLRECIRRSMQSALSISVQTYSTLSELGALRNVMRKMDAKNRTDVAMEANTLAHSAF